MTTSTITSDHIRSFILANNSDEIERNLDAIGDSLGLIGQSEAMRSLVRDICRVAPTEVAVLVTGESGTGKDVVARAIHQLSPRRTRSLVIVNSGAIAEGILESELFGHERGAFTGAVSERKGYFETANSGTIFLDEIGDMPLATQVKLLRVLETGEFLRVGGSVTKTTDVRVIAATNRNLEQMVRRGEFRKDLYYRLKAITLRLPPLRARAEDIPVLVERFAAEFMEHTHAASGGFSREAMDAIVRYRWPGNVRELKNFVESVMTLKRGDEVTEQDVMNNILNFKDVDDWSLADTLHLPVPTHITPEQAERELLYRTLLSLKQDITEIKHFLATRLGSSKPADFATHVGTRDVYDTNLRESKVVETEVYNVDENGTDKDTMTLNEAEREMIIKALKRFDGKRSLAAKSLGLSERTLYRKIRQYDLDL